MVTIVKHEWHSHDRQYAIELDENLLSEIYPDMDEDEISNMLQQIEDGEIDVSEVLDAAYDNDVEIEWDFQYDDCYSDRKGGYDVTYELGDENSWHTEPPPPEPTHKCTKCRWTGESYETATLYLREDGSVISQYFEQDEEDCHDTKDVCPMCDSEVELTPAGLEKEKERAEWRKKWEEEAELDDEEVPCFSCETPYKESELEFLGGQYICPNCGEGWVMKDDRNEDSKDDES